MFCVKVLNECVGIICYVGCWVVFDMSVCMFVIEVFVMDAMNVVFFVKNANTTPFVGLFDDDVFVIVE